MKIKKALAFAAAFCLMIQAVPAAGTYAEETESKDSFIYGDIDEDGGRDITDLSLLSLHLIKDITLQGNRLKAADTDGNGTVNLADLAHFRMYLSKYAVKLGPQEDPKLKIRQISDYGELKDLIDMTSEDLYIDGPEYDKGWFADSSINAVESPTVSAPTLAPGSAPATPDDTRDYYETYNQEENVLEADIVKTDGNAVFSLSGKYDRATGRERDAVSAVYVSDGRFTGKQTTEIDFSDSGMGTASGCTVNNMYLYGDMIIVLGTVNFPYSGSRLKSYQRYTFVSAYSKGSEDKAPELIDTYYQEGAFNDVRITPDGYMYLISNGNFRDGRKILYRDYYMNEPVADDAAEDNTDDGSEAELWIPKAGTNECVAPVAPENIYIPNEPDKKCSPSYTVIGSIDLSTPNEIRKSDIRVVSGYTGDIYCSENNLYLTHQRYSYRWGGMDPAEVRGEKTWNVTEITRVSVSGGKITPEATGEVPGYVKDQFSMSEYKGYFRIVTTADYGIPDGEYYKSERSNNVYVLDQNLEKTGEITHFAKDESVKSVSFAGDLGYIVTYVQTDPLFAVDFSEPSAPVILDEYKIDGFSTYMQKWDDGHLLGFGLSTHVNEWGGEVRDGYKLVMFDNSNPEKLDEDGIYKLLKDDFSLAEYADVKISEEDKKYLYGGLSSNAEYDRKQLIIAPEKNIIGFPVSWNVRSRAFNELENEIDVCGDGYCFFSYDDGEFTLKNFVGDINNFDRTYYRRAVYIGDYLYIISNSKMIAADIDTCTKTDEIEFLK